MKLTEFGFDPWIRFLLVKHASREVKNNFLEVRNNFLEVRNNFLEVKNNFSEGQFRPFFVICV